MKKLLMIFLLVVSFIGKPDTNYTMEQTRGVVRLTRNQEGEEKQNKAKETIHPNTSPIVLANALVNVPTSSLNRKENTAFVYNWADLLDALTNFQITNIQLQNHIVIPSTENGAGSLVAQYARLRNGRTQPVASMAEGWVNNIDRIFWRSLNNIPGTTISPAQATGEDRINGSESFIGLRRNDTANPHTEPVVIDGQGKYAIDNGGVTFTWHDEQPHQHHFRNLTTFTGNYWGWMTYNDLADTVQRNSHFIYENIVHHGTQFSHTPQTPITMRGYVAMIQPDHLAFDSPFREGLWSHNYRFFGFQETNLYANDLAVEDGAQIYLRSASTGNISLNGRMTVGENALLYLSGSFIGQRNNHTVIESGRGIEDDSMGYGVHFRSENASLNLGQGSRLFIHSDETRTGGLAIGGALLFTGVNASLRIEKGASLEVFAQGNTNTEFQSTWNATRGALISMSNDSKIEVEDYGRFQIFSENMGDGLPPLSIFGTSSVRVGENGIFDITADTRRQLIWTQGLGSQSANILFDNAYRINLHRFGAGSQSNPNALVGHQQEDGTTTLNVRNQQIVQWDNGNESQVGNRIAFEETQLGSIMHANPIPTGQMMKTSIDWEVEDNGYSRAFAAVYSVGLNFQGGTANATSVNIDALRVSTISDIHQQLGRSTSEHGHPTHATGGAKPNRLLFSKLHKVEVQLFSRLTDNPDISARDFHGSVTQGIARDASDNMLTNTDGTYQLKEADQNAERRTFTYDPRREIIGRTGAHTEIIRYIPQERIMRRERVFVPIERAKIRLDENGSIQPIVNQYMPIFHGLRPKNEQTMNVTDFHSQNIGETTFADWHYAIQSSDENGIVLDSTGERIVGAGFFVYVASENFLADDMIRLSAFSEGQVFVYGEKEELQSLRVHDETPPTAQPLENSKSAETALRLPYSGTGNFPEASFFVENLKDTNPFSDMDDFYSIDFDFSLPEKEIIGVTPIVSKEHFAQVISNVNAQETENFSVGVLVSDPAGNTTRVDSLFSVAIKTVATVNTRDLFIKESDFLVSSISSDQVAMKNWLIQQGIQSVEIGIKDGVEALGAKRIYIPLLTGNLDEQIFEITEMNQLFEEQEMGKVYQIEGSLRASRANPSAQVSNGVVEDVPITFRVMLISDVLRIVNAENLHFGTRELSALDTNETFEAKEDVTVLEINDKRNLFDTSAGTIMLEEVFVKDQEKETIQTGHVDDIKQIREKQTSEIASGWSIAVSLTGKLQDKKGNILNGTIGFGRGILTSGENQRDFVVDRFLDSDGTPTHLVQGKSASDSSRINFLAKDITLHVPTTERRFGEFSGEITYTVSATPEF